MRQEMATVSTERRLALVVEEMAGVRRRGDGYSPNGQERMCQNVPLARTGRSELNAHELHELVFLIVGMDSRQRALLKYSSRTGVVKSFMWYKGTPSYQDAQLV